MAMKTLKAHIPIVLAGAAGAAIVILVVWMLALPAVVSFADRHNGLAAWVQAVFSVVAIVGTWAVAEKQAATARQQRLDEDAAREVERVNAYRARVEGIRTVASAFADLTIERLVACEAILQDSPQAEDIDGLRHDLSYTRQLLMDFKVADLGAAR